MYLRNGKKARLTGAPPSNTESNGVQGRKGRQGPQLTRSYVRDLLVGRMESMNNFNQGSNIIYLSFLRNLSGFSGEGE